MGEQAGLHVRFQSRQRPGTWRLRRYAPTGKSPVWGLIRTCRSGWKIGTLFAADATTATMIAADLVSPLGGELLSLDVPEPTKAAAALASRLGLAPVFETARMYHGVAPDLPIGRIFGIWAIRPRRGNRARPAPST